MAAPSPEPALPIPPPDGGIHDVGPDPHGLRGGRQYLATVMAGVLPTDDVLEIGCGIGRLAHQLAAYLTSGSYTGFDVSAEAIEWLNTNYAPHLPNFSFDLLDVRNDRYHPGGARDAVDATFPYPDASFDHVCSFAVFMHMPLPEIARYLSETRRILRPGGRALVTVPLVVDPATLPMAIGGDPLVSVGGGVYARRAECPTWGLAFDRDLVLGAIADAGLVVVQFGASKWGAATEGAHAVHELAGGDAFLLAAAP